MRAMSSASRPAGAQGELRYTASVPMTPPSEARIGLTSRREARRAQRRLAPVLPERVGRDVGDDDLAAEVDGRRAGAEA